MNEIIIYRIIIGVVIVGIIFWLYFKKNKINQVDDTAILEKEKEIEGLKKEKIGFEQRVNDLKDSLTNERNTTAEQLKAINKIDEHKSSISKYTIIHAHTTKQITAQHSFMFTKNIKNFLKRRGIYNLDITETIQKDPSRNKGINYKTNEMYLLCSKNKNNIYKYKV